MNNSGKFFAGFIITYNRPDQLSNTIDVVLSQSIPPEKLLIIDNGSDPITEQVVSSKVDSRIVYHRASGNLGPSGAASVGLEMLSKEGFKLIYWGDDNDPPIFSDAFEKLIDLFDKDQQLGVAGMVGHTFNTSNGLIVRTPDSKLSSRQVISVDVVSGNQTMIVSSEVVKKSILPDTNLFFGFEELDFCLSVKKSGFRINVPTELFLRSRKLWGKENYKSPIYKKKPIESLWREYYSTRNMLYILRKNGLHHAFLISLVRFFFKSSIGFRFGYSYGVQNFRFIFKGVIDYFSGVMGKQNLK